MTTLTKIGNSQGIRIPKPIIKQANLEDCDIELKVVEDGLLLKPIKKTSRKKWADNIEETLSKYSNKNDKAILSDFLDDSDLDDWEW